MILATTQNTERKWHKHPIAPTAAHNTRHCNLCDRPYFTRNRFSRFCRVCRLQEVYKSSEWLPIVQWQVD